MNSQNQNLSPNPASAPVENLDYREILKGIQALSQDLESTDYCLSLYVPFDPEDANNTNQRDHQSTKFKAAFQEAIRNFKKMQMDDKTRTALVDFATRSSASIDLTYPGVSFFMVFNSQPDNSTETPVKAAQLVPVFLRPVAQAGINKHFDLGQLIENANFDNSYLILKLHMDKVEISSYENLRLRSLQNLATTYESEADRQDPYVPVNESTFGRGGDKNWSLENTRAFWNGDIVPRLNFEYRTNFDRVIIFYGSNHFDELREAMDADLKKLFQDIYFEKKLPASDSELIGDIKQLEAQIILEKKQHELSAAKNAFELFKTDVNEIVSAVLQGQIETLYFRPGAENLEKNIDSEIFNGLEDEIKDLTDSSSLLPWLINRLIKTGGQAVCLREPEFAEEQPLLAKLRFNLSD